ncbi:MAG: hypothetical protein O2871_03860 [bacterium]|nr:hypothetical protein [bacterium]
MTDFSKYKNITLPKETYEKISKVAETGFDVPISRSKCVVHIFNLWLATQATSEPKPKHIINNSIKGNNYYAENKR